MARTKNFADKIRAKLAADPALADAVDAAAIDTGIAAEIYEARMEARLTQKQLADRAGTHQSVIARMEDADYQGHSVTMLRRIARALGKRFRCGFYAAPEPDQLRFVDTISLDWTEIEWQPEFVEEIKITEGCQTHNITVGQ